VSVQKPLSLRERAGVREQKADNLLIINPLILAFSLREKGCVEFLDRH